MKAYDLDLRRRIVATVEEGVSTVETAKRFKVSAASVKRYVKQMREVGSVVPKVRPGRQALLGAKELEILQAQVRQSNDLTLAEHSEQLAQATGVQASVATLHRAFKHLKITKRQNSQANATRKCGELAPTTSGSGPRDAGFARSIRVVGEKPTS